MERWPGVGWMQPASGRGGGGGSQDGGDCSAPRMGEAEVETGGVAEGGRY